MEEKKHADAIREVLETIDQATAGGDMLAFQRRLASMLSLGTQHIFELYLHRLNIFKPGSHIKHEWFALGDRNFKTRLSAVLTAPYENIPHADEIIVSARDIEIDRNEMVYGSPLLTDKRLREKIDSFLEIKKIVEMTGDVL